MIIKSKPIKSKKGTKNVLRYILSQEKNINNDFVLTRYIRGDAFFSNVLKATEHNLEKGIEILEQRVENIFIQLEGNNLKRKIKRSNANRIYHEIISFHKSDTQKLNQKELKHIARHYAKIRSKNSIVVSALHTDKDHLHIHNVVSAVEYATGKTVRLSRSEFKEVKIKMEEYQDKYLKLEHSRVNHNKKKDKSLLRDVEYQINLRGKRSKKQLLQLQLASAYSESKSKEQFFQKLQKQGLELYSRAGKTVGLKHDNKKYRLKTLGFSKDKIQNLDVVKDIKQLQSRLQSLQKQRKNKQPNKDLER